MIAARAFLKSLLTLVAEVNVGTLGGRVCLA